jgi:hypothetical protein
MLKGTSPEVDLFREQRSEGGLPGTQSGRSLAPPAQQRWCPALGRASRSSQNPRTSASTPGLQYSEDLCVWPGALSGPCGPGSQFPACNFREFSPSSSLHTHSYWISNCSGLVARVGLSSTVTPVTVTAVIVDAFFNSFPWASTILDGL